MKPSARRQAQPPAPPIDPDTYQFDTSAAGNASFRSMLDDVAAEADDQPQAQSSASGDQKARDDRDHNAADNIQLPPDQPPGGSGPTPGSFGASIAWGGCVAEHTVVGAAKGAVVGGASGAVIGAGYGAAGGAEAGTLVAPGFGTLGGAAAGAVTGTTVGMADSAYIGGAAGIADGIDHCGDITSQPQPADHIVENRGVPGLTMPTISIPLNGTPGGLRSKSEPGDDAEQKAGVDSENQVADRTAAAGYPTIQNPTRGLNPPLTRERMIAEGLDPKKTPTCCFPTACSTPTRRMRTGPVASDAASHERSRTSRPIAWWWIFAGRRKPRHRFAPLCGPIRSPVSRRSWS